MSIWEIISYSLLVGYCSLILFYFIGWLRIKTFTKDVKTSPLNKFSILIPARNEASGILECLTCLTNQQYPSSSYEIIILNDYSSDNTWQLVQAFKNKFTAFNIRLVNLADHIPEAAKKEAITYGVSIALHPYIILTDADCSRGNKWLVNIDAYIQKNQAKMIYAPVMFQAGTVFEKIQSLEFAGLVGIGAAAIQLKNPNMCSAANLIFNKEVFYEVQGYQNNQNLASGDDEFLLHKVFKKYPQQVFFLKSFDAVVQTSPNGTLQQLTQQRRRWVSKSTKYEDRYITVILVGAYLFNFTILFNLLYGIFDPLFFKTGMIQLLIKMMVEGLFLFNILRFFKQSILIVFLPLVEPFHILYVLIIGIWANITTYQWKGRKLN
ncbi:MAG: glycosyltransferase [Bacteroidia bacterium]|nr:glycosyltransferase [Bacteroidia bacterium]